jgi:hypothetical protein
METESRHRADALRFRILAEAATDLRVKAIMLRIAELHDKIADRLAEIGRIKD